MAINVARPLVARSALAVPRHADRTCVYAFFTAPDSPVIVGYWFGQNADLLFQYMRCRFFDYFFILSLVLCLCEVCWYKFMEWTTESFAENPKEKLLAEFNLTMSHSNTRAVQTFSEMHTNRHRERENGEKNPNAFHMAEMRRKPPSRVCVFVCTKASRKKSLCRRDSFDIWQHNNFRNYISLIKLFY